MLELMLCSSLTILPDFLFRRFVQGKRLGRDITLFSVWYELRWGITLCVLLTLSLITAVFYFHPSTTNAVSYFRTISILPEGSGRVAEVYVDYRDHVKAGDPLFRLDSVTAKLTALGKVDAGKGEAYGICLYKAPEATYAFIQSNF